jgi:hypothetical protein
MDNDIVDDDVTTYADEQTVNGIIILPHSGTLVLMIEGN